MTITGHPQPLTSDAAPLWARNTFTPDAWTLTLTSEHVHELIDAVTFAQDRMRDRDPFTDRHMVRGDFPLSAEHGMAAVLANLTETVAHGHGFAVLRGLPTDRLDERQNTLLLRGIAAHLGTIATQSRDGQLIRHVRATGNSLGDGAVRGHQTAERLYFHTDGADAAILLCLTAAPSGGLSRLASAATVHNRLLALAPEAVAELYQPFHFHMAGGHVPGLPETFISPVFSHHQGRFSTRYVRHTLLETSGVAGVPPLSQAALDAFDLLEETAGGVSIDMELRPGDLQVVNNHAVLHSRTAYKDDPTSPRHLLRSWITLDGYEGRRASATDEFLRAGWLTDDRQQQIAADWRRVLVEQ